MTFPFIPETALSASASEAYATKPKPLDLPEDLSIIILAVS